VRILVIALLVTVAAAASQAQATPPVLVAFQQAGGFAGIERGLVVSKTGKISSNGLALKTSQLTPARLRTLRSALVQARFAALDDHYESDAPIADGFVYHIAYGDHVVAIDEGATLPPRLSRVFALLLALRSTR
jgi:hypothetical protein